MTRTYFSKRPTEKSNRRNESKDGVVVIPREDYLALLNLRQAVREFFEYRNDPKIIEQERIKQETLREDIIDQGWVGPTWTIFVPVVSEDWTRKHERRKEIIRKGAWNPSKKGWEYDGDFVAIWY